MDDNRRRIAAVYVRVAAAEGGAVEPQKAGVLRYCHEQGLGITGIYVDEGVSGFKPFEERDAGALLLKDAETHNFDTLVVYQYDRLGRDVESVAAVVAKMGDLGIEVRTVQPEQKVIPMKLQLAEPPLKRRRRRA